jgi:hypothetical protein
MADHNTLHPDDFPPDLKAFEAALAGLIPAESRLSRDRLMYFAGAAAATPNGKQSAVRSSRLPAILWPLATAALFLVALGLSALVALRQPTERIVYMDRPAARLSPNNAPTLAAHWPQTGSIIVANRNRSGSSYLVLREQVLKLGVGALDAPSGAAEPADHSDVRNRALLNHLLGS